MRLAGVLLLLLLLLVLPAEAGNNRTGQLRDELLAVERRLLQHERALAAVLRAELRGLTEAADLLSQPVRCPPRSKPNPAAAEARRRSFRALDVVSLGGPRLGVVHDFLSKEECDYIRHLGNSLLENSVVVGASDGAGLRRSRSATLNSRDTPARISGDKVLRRILERIEQLTYIPMEHFEPIQLGEYTSGDFYSFHKDSDSQMGRIATFLIYLEAPDEGGETILPGVSRPHGKYGLPELRWGDKDQPDMPPYCKHPSVFKVAPRQGSAILFFNHLPDLQADPFALHGACHVHAGRKTVLQQWILWYDRRHGNTFYNKHVKAMESGG